MVEADDTYFAVKRKHHVIIFRTAVSGTKVYRRRLREASILAYRMQSKKIYRRDIVDALATELYLPLPPQLIGPLPELFPINTELLFPERVFLEKTWLDPPTFLSSKPSQPMSFLLSTACEFVYFHNR